MPQYTVTDPTTGRKVTLTGDGGSYCQMLWIAA